MTTPIENQIKNWGLRLSSDQISVAKSRQAGSPIESETRSEKNIERGTVWSVGSPGSGQTLEKGPKITERYNVHNPAFYGTESCQGSYVVGFLV